MEIFKRVDGHLKYFIGNEGTLKNEHRILKGTKTKLGYISYFVDGKWCLGHRLVAIAFIPNPDNLPEVNHKKGIKTDNRASELEWCTHAENVQRCYDSGQRKKITGKDHWRTGSTHNETTKGLMREKKLGERHPKFKGWYVIEGKKYGSSYEAERGTGIARYNILRWCKSGKEGYGFDRVN